MSNYTILVKYKCYRYRINSISKSDVVIFSLDGVFKGGGTYIN